MVSLTSNEPIEHTKVVAKKLDYKYLPAAKSAVIELIIDPQEHGNHVYTSSVAAGNDERLYAPDFLMNIVPRDDDFRPIPYTVVLKNKRGGMLYPVVAHSPTGPNGSEFHIIDVTNSGIPTVYYAGFPDMAE